MGHSGFPSAEGPTTTGRVMPGLCQAALRAREHVQARGGGTVFWQGGQQEPKCLPEVPPAAGLRGLGARTRGAVGSTFHSGPENTRQAVGWKRDPRSWSKARQRAGCPQGPGPGQGERRLPTLPELTLSSSSLRCPRRGAEEKVSPGQRALSAWAGAEHFTCTDPHGPRRWWVCLPFLRMTCPEGRHASSLRPSQPSLAGRRAGRESQESCVATNRTKEIHSYRRQGPCPITTVSVTPGAKLPA